MGSPKGSRVGAHRATLSRNDADSLRLVEAIKRGEDKPLDTLYNRYFDALYGYLASLLDCAADAEDLAQHTFEEAIRALDRYEVRGAASFRSWLFAIARNLAVDHQRKHRRVDLIPPHQMQEQMAVLGNTTSEPYHGMSWVSDARLMAALQRLPSLPREVVVLRYVGDFELAEIGDVIGVSENSVKQAHRRALRALRERLSILAA